MPAEETAGSANDRAVAAPVGVPRRHSDPLPDVVAAATATVDADPDGEPERSAEVRLQETLDELATVQEAFAVGQESIARVQRNVEELGHDKARLEDENVQLARWGAEASHQATHDVLTGLPNRALLLDRFHHAIAQTDRKQQQLAMLFIDLDHFKRVNDDFGHVVGDKVLKDVATRLQSSIRSADTAGRYGGDEFVIMLPELDPEISASYFAMKICNRLAGHYAIDGVDLSLRASIGIAIYPDHGRRWEDLVRHVDAEMYRTRADHRAAPQATESLDV